MNKRLELKTDLLPENTIAELDEVRLKQVLGNLIDNAVKFSAKGYVHFGVSRKGQILKFFVKDTGVGIDKNLKSVVFERFRKAETSDNNAMRGTGLGLSITKNLVELMGGRIDFESEVNNGTTFWIELPIHESHLNRTSWLKSGDEPYTILVVEDDEVNRQYLSELLQKNEFDFDVVSGCKEANRLLAKNEYHLMLVDTILHCESVYKFISQIRIDYPSITVIAQTARTGIEEYQKCIDAGADDYLAKPFSEEVLLFKIGKHLHPY